MKQPACHHILAFIYIFDLYTTSRIWWLVDKNQRLTKNSVKTSKTQQNSNSYNSPPKNFNSSPFCKHPHGRSKAFWMP
jgi:hypothetical protein